MGHVQGRQLEAEMLKRARQASWVWEGNLRGSYGWVGEGEEEGQSTRTALIGHP